MKTLIVTACNSKWLRDVWLPTLREKGEYTGDVLILDYGDMYYDMSDEHTFVHHVKSIGNHISNDRFSLFKIYLKKIYNNYDVIMHSDGGDVEFVKPIQPLLEMGAKELCATYAGNVKLKDLKNCWVAYERVKEYEEKFGDNLDINMGIFVAPTAEFYKVIKFIADNILPDDKIAIDELLFNVYVYGLGNHCKIIGREWNYLSNVFESRDEHRAEANILHFAGTRQEYPTRKDRDSFVMKPKTVIIVPTTNINSDNFRRCYEAIKNNTTLPYELVIVESHLNEYLFNFDRVANTGMRDLETFDYYVICNDDLFVPPNWLENFIAVANQDPKIGIVGGLYHSHGMINHAGGLSFYNPKFPCATDLTHKLYGVPLNTLSAYKQEDCVFVTGALQFFTHDCLAKIGLLLEPTRLGYGDVEICYRAWNNGFRVVYTPSVIAEHLGGSSVCKVFNGWSRPLNYAEKFCWKYTKEEYDELIRKVDQSNKEHPTPDPIVPDYIKPLSFKSRGRLTFPRV